MFYTRRLPHWQPANADFFVTWRLYGSLPRCKAPCIEMSAGEKFVAMDRQLDEATSGPRWLQNTRVADAVSQVLLAGADVHGWYELAAWVVMPNHMHVLLEPRVPLRKALDNLKSGSARIANELLGRKGNPFWQDESYDRWVRSDIERQRIVRYIEKNPVKAGLVSRLEDWRWSSANWAAHGAAPL
jgi:REP element-mobilizing transposase RayT